MKHFRGLTKDGKMVYGWLAEIEGKYFIIDIKAELRPLTAYGKYGKPGEGWKEFFGTYGIAGFIEVIPATVAQQVGLKDKNDKEGYENDKVSFGSTRPVYLVKWSICNAGFYLESIDEQKEHLGIANFTVGEIIPPEVKEQPK